MLLGIADDVKFLIQPENSFKSTKLTSSGALALFKSLESHDYLRYVDFSSIELDDIGVKGLSDLMRYNESIEVLIIEDNKLTDEGLQELLDSIVGNRILKEISVKDNKSITSKSVEWIKDTIKSSAIKIFNVDSTQINRAANSEIKAQLEIPIEDRYLPIQSTTKSAAKIS